MEIKSAIQNTLNQVDDLKSKINDGEYLKLCNSLREIYQLAHNTRKICLCTDSKYLCLGHDIRTYCRNYGIIRQYCPLLARHYDPNEAGHQLDTPVQTASNLSETEIFFRIIKCHDYLIRLFKSYESGIDRLVTFISIIQLIINHHHDDIQMSSITLDRMDHLIEMYEMYDSEYQIINTYLLKPVDWLAVLKGWRDRIDEKIVIMQMMSLPHNMV